MQNFSFESFFDLSSFAHKELFEEGSPVWQALKNIDRFLRAQSLGKIEGKIEEGAYLFEPELITIGEGSVVEAGAYIRGPALIGKGCEIRHGAYLRGNVILGDHAVVGHASEVKNSILLNGAKAGHFAYVGDSILGNDVNLGAGVKCANLRLDRREVTLTTAEGVVKTGLRKFGAIIGDRCELGCNSVLNPGTLIGKRSFCYPGMVLSGFIPPASFLKGA